MQQVALFFRTYAVYSLVLSCLLCSACRGQSFTNDYRYWRSPSGKQSKVRLRFVSADDVTVDLQREDSGKVVTINMKALGSADQQFVRSLTRKPTLNNVQPSSAVASANNWARFRGPTGDGIAPEDDRIPVAWDDDTNVSWKLDLPGAGSSSPIIWGNHIYVTCFTGTEADSDESRHDDTLRLFMICVDKQTGRIAWKQEVDDVQQPDKPMDGAMKYHGYSSGTAAADSQGVVVYFGATGLISYSHEGEQQWKVVAGRRMHQWSSSVTPAIHNNKVFVNAGLEADKNPVIAYDRKTGEERWRTEWQSHTWGVMQIATIGGRAMLVDAQHGAVRAYDPEDGTKLWEVSGADAGSALLIHKSVCYQQKFGARFTNDSAKRIWRADGMGRMAAPLVYEGRLYCLTGGKFVCIDAATGDFIYRERAKDWATSQASAIVVGNHIYHVSRHHGVFVIEAGDELKILSHNVFADDKTQFNGTPAVSAGNLYLRSDQTLYCIGS